MALPRPRPPQALESIALPRVERFLSASDADRALCTFRKLARHDIQCWALTGGLAVETHRLRLGRPPCIRVLNDLDFIADAFECIPTTLTDDFLFRHIHPSDPPGKTMLQFVDPESALRVDVFRASGAIVSRTFLDDGGFLDGDGPLDHPVGSIRLVSLEDLIARSARLALDIVEGVRVPSKHPRDFLRLVELLDPAKVETAWRDHRKPSQPRTFDEANRLLQDLIPTRRDWLTRVDYSKDAAEICTRCAPTANFRLADPRQVLDLLGYC